MALVGGGLCSWRLAGLHACRLYTHTWCGSSVHVQQACRLQLVSTGEQQEEPFCKFSIEQCVTRCAWPMHWYSHLDHMDVSVVACLLWC
jgi:hypothetical protein